MYKSPAWAAFIDTGMAADVSAALSRPRLARYGASNPAVGSDIERIARHGRNIAICEALYPSLHLLEVVMRNGIHSSFSSYFRASDWYEGHWLTDGHRRMVDEAKAALIRRKRSPDPDRVVAELSFGFWCGMFHRAYERGAGPWPALLKTALPRAPKRWRTRDKVQARIEEIRELRNRVFHHEPIIGYADLSARHRRIVEVLGWLSPATRLHLEQVCRFQSVLGDDLVPVSHACD